jgi:protein kinase-like protein
VNRLLRPLACTEPGAPISPGQRSARPLLWVQPVTCRSTAPGPRRGLPLLAATCAQGLREGQVVGGRYRVGRVLSAGGMGSVFSGHVAGSGTPVVIKVPRADLEGSCMNCVRLEHEGQTAALLDNPHLVRLMSTGCLGSGVPFLVMERLEGTDLGMLVRANGPLSAGVAVNYVRQACLGLAAMHRAGLVHRDVKPGNLFLCTRGSQGPLIKVIDFGLAKSIRATSDDTQLTGNHMLLGSPSYASPEQIRQLDVDPRADIWSLGVVLFELLTGSKPFTGGTIVDVCAQILTQPIPSMRERQPDIDPALDAIVRRCLAKERLDRHGSVLELYEALRPFDHASQTQPPSSGAAPVAIPLHAVRGETAARRTRRAAYHRFTLAALLLLAIVLVSGLPTRWAELGGAHGCEQACSPVQALPCARGWSTPAFPVRYARLP